MRAILPVVLLFGLAFAPDVQAEPTCSYDSWQWNTFEKRAVNFVHVVHPYAEIGEEERDGLTGCTVCSEDQMMLAMPPLEPFHICRRIAQQVRSALQRALEAGARIKTVTGYRVGRTRGEIDADGNRTGFSNHSFGVALDIDPQYNGLYDHCARFGPGCMLIRGGAWRPGEVPQSIGADSPVVRAMKEAGFLWGGEIRGKQKDFMHFSPTGY